MLLDTGQIMPVPHNPYEINAWRKKAEYMESNYSKRMGILIGPVEVVVHTAILKGLRRTDEGAMIKEYAVVAGIETDYAAQTVVYDVASEDQRFLEKAALPIEEEFPEATRAFFLGEFNYGRPLEVIRHENNKVDVWICTMVRHIFTASPFLGRCDEANRQQKGKEPDFGQQISQRAEQTTRYTPSYAVARQLGLNTLVLSKITSSFSVMVDDQRCNLGLNLKFEAKKMKVLGYSRRGDAGWEFSPKAVELLHEYIQRFPAFFSGVQRNPHGDMYSDTDFFDPSESKARVKEIVDWLKSIQSRSFEKVPLEAQQLDSDVVKEIEQAADAYLATDQKSIEFKRVKNVPRKALLKPSDAEHRLHSQWFSIGDRVVYVQDSGKVPIATRGTVIGLTRTPRATLLDVVFDPTFMSGNTLGDRCSPFRGMTVPTQSVLNLTNRQLIAGSKASATINPSPAAPESVAAQLSGTNGRVISDGLKPAQMPAQLMGSFSSAIQGQQTNGYNSRGRGGRGSRSGYHNGNPDGSRGGFNGSSRGQANMTMRGGPPVIMQRPQQQGQDEESQKAKYQNVPPPAVLMERGGRGGRGPRGERRAGGARGRGGRSGNTGSNAQSRTAIPVPVEEPQ